MINIPSYVAKCGSCGAVFPYFSTIAERWELVPCEACGAMASRNEEEELASVKVSHKWITDNERWSVSMGVPRKQVEEFRKRFPKSTYDDNGRLLIKNRKDKLRQAKERGFVELDSNHTGR